MMLYSVECFHITQHLPDRMSMSVKGTLTAEGRIREGGKKEVSSDEACEKVLQLAGALLMLGMQMLQGAGEGSPNCCRWVASAYTALPLPAASELCSHLKYAVCNAYLSGWPRLLKY